MELGWNLFVHAVVLDLSPDCQHRTTERNPQFFPELGPFLLDNSQNLTGPLRYFP